MQQHRYPFFGQKVGLLFDSALQNIPSIYLRFIKKKNSGEWEKPSAHEGKVIKFNLLEIISIIEVLDHPGSKWTTVHRFQQESTPITVEHKGKNVLILIPGYQKYLGLNEVILLGDILKHVYEEKISYATGGVPNQIENSNSSNGFKNSPSTSNIQNPTIKSSSTPPITNNSFKSKSDIYNLPSQSNIQESNSPSNQTNTTWLNSLELDSEYYLIPGEIETRSTKAVAFQVQNKNLMWVPISCIKEVLDDGERKGIWIKKWFVEKKVEDILCTA